MSKLADELEAQLSKGDLPVLPLWLRREEMQSIIAALRSDAQPDRDWTEDAAHENGEYSCFCSTCGNQFVGHKRRVTCKACTHPQPGPEGWKLVPPDLLRQLRHYTECHLMLYKDCGAPTVEEVDAMLAAAPGAPK